MIRARINLIIKLFHLCTLSILGGCTGMTYSNHFDCPYGKGAGCASLSKVNQMIDRQQINLDEPNSTTCVESQGSSCNNKMRQIYIYYGPEQMGKVITIESPQGLSVIGS